MEGVLVESKAILSIMDSSGHCDNKVRGSVSVRAEKAWTTGSKAHSWLVRMAEVGVDVKLRREKRNCEMISSMAEVTSPFHSSRSGLGALVGRL